jgi:signal peptidase II
MPQRSYRLVLWAIVLVGIGLDQTTKYAMFAWQKGRAEQHFTTQVFEMDNGLGFALQARHCKNDNGQWEPQLNTGALNGWLRDNEQANNGFALISLLAAVLIVYWSFRQATARDRWLCICLGLILAGTLGNLYDRVVFSGVRDFLDFYWAEHHWPTFNLADSCLVCGAVLLLLQSFGSKKATEQTPQASPTTTAAQLSGVP